MRRTIIIVPELLDDGNSVLRQKLPSLEAMTELGRLFKVPALPPLQTPEALYLGLDPAEAQMEQGPLTVAALGAEPPERSTHFHVSLLSLVDGQLAEPQFIASPEELESLWVELQKLNTRSLTLLRGEGLNHGLVWENFGDVHCLGAAQVEGASLRDSLPEGDAEKVLRRLIDDSVNLLGELEFNLRRRDEGLQPINIAWPWGPGRRVAVPNLMLRRGERAVVESESMRLHGLSHLAGYVHEDPRVFGRGLNTKLAPLAKRCLGRDLSLVLLDAPAQLRGKGQLEELEWFAKQMDSLLLEPLLEDALQNHSRTALFAPSARSIGLGVVLDSPSAIANVCPFDERSLEEARIPTQDLTNLVAMGLRRPDVN